MVNDLRPYSTYKDSGLSWLGLVPEHWAIRRLRDTTEGCISGIWGNDPDGRYDLPCVRVADFDRQRFRVRLKKLTLRSIPIKERRERMLVLGDLLLEKSGGGDKQPVGMVVLYDHDVPAVCSNFVARLPVSPEFNSAYLVYLHSHLYAIRLNLRSIKQTTGIQNLGVASYLGEFAAFPPLPEQSAIVRFLDYAERRIQRYIRAKKRLIALLNEQKQAIIHRAVTRGLDPNVRLKSSGVEWLGEVPEHWSVAQIRSVARVVRGSSPRPAGSPLYFHGTGMPWITVGEVTKDSDMYLTLTTTRLTPAGAENSRTIEAGTLLLTNSGATLGIPKISLIEGCINDGVAALLNPRVNREFLYFFLATQTTHLKAWVSLGAQPNLNTQIIGGWPVVLPPATEQSRLVDYVKQKTATITKSIYKARHEISLLHEYRTSLIAEVVTGKLDVREAAARLPEEAKEPESLDEGEVMGDDESEGEAADLEGLPEEVMA